MEWNPHLTAIQGALMSIEKISGPLTNIKYKEDGENEICNVILAIQKYFISKNFIQDNALNPVYGAELESVVQLLFLNTAFRSDCLLDTQALSHLRNVTPKLSKCLLANILVELDLLLYYGKMLMKVPIQPHLELLVEFKKCIKQSEPEDGIEHAYVLMSEYIKVVCSLQDQEIIDKILNTLVTILKHIPGITRQLQDRKTKQISQHKGITFLFILRLLNQCPIDLQCVNSLIEKLIEFAVLLSLELTINIFCIWAEVIFEGQTLQRVIANEAYLVTVHLTNYKPAENLLELIENIVAKPKTLEEIAADSDMPTIISKINMCNSEQSVWFHYFIQGDPLQSEECIDCLKKWSHLCSKDDVAVILNNSVTYNEHAVKETVIKCAATLSTDDLIDATIEYIITHDSCNLDIGTIDDQLKLILNKLEIKANPDENVIKQIILMLLQNHKQVLVYLFKKCINGTGIIPCLRPIFERITDVAKINQIAVTALGDIWQNSLPSFENLSSYTNLLNVLLELSYINEEAVIISLFLPVLANSSSDSRVLLGTLEVFKAINIEYKFQDTTVPIIVALLNVMERNRCQLLTYMNLSQQIVCQCVCILFKYNRSIAADEAMKSKCEDILNDIEISNNLNKYYADNMGNALQNNFLHHIYPTYNNSNIAGLLEMLLPSCVEQEWICIVNELEAKFGFTFAYQLLTNVLIILCQFGESQSGNSTSQLKDGLKYCLEIYGIIIRDVFRQTHANLDEEIFIAQMVCKLLAAVPQDIRQTEALGLAHLLSTDALRSLKSNKSFILLLVSIKDVTISKLLANKMVS